LNCVALADLGIAAANEAVLYQRPAFGFADNVRPLGDSLGKVLDGAGTSLSGTPSSRFDLQLPSKPQGSKLFYLFYRNRNACLHYPFGTA
jgi:hypothetical protein